MKLTPLQFAAAERGGCRFSAASAVEVQRLSMQSRIFWYEGQPYTARRATGFQETAGTLAKLIAEQEQSAPPPPVAEVAPPPDVPAVPQEVEDRAAASREDGKNPVADPLAAEAPPEAPQAAELPEAAAEETAVQSQALVAATKPARTRGRSPRSRRGADAAPPLAEETGTAGIASGHGLVRSGSGRVTALALHIAAAQAAGSQIGGEDFVTLVDRVHRTLSAL